MEISKQNQKSIPVTQKMVLEAYKEVRKKGKTGGVDKIDIEEFEKKAKDYLYKIWNRMSSGSYFPPPVKRVYIAKKGGAKRPLGIPTIGDRIAQMVVKQKIEVRLEKVYHRSSYGYRRGRSSHGAVEKVLENTKKYPWVLDVDIKGFFDNVDHVNLMKALELHIEEHWIRLYIRRWLKAGVEGGSEVNQKGTPQGGVVSPILANLFLHYTIDKWFEIKYPKLEMVRYSDDSIFHCRTKREAEKLKQSLQERLEECGLEMNVDKTKIVYCKDYRREGDYPNKSFDFLGFSFKPTTKKGRSLFLSYDAGISKESRKKIREELRRTKFHRWTNHKLEDVSKQLNPKIRGWVNYYGKYGKYALKEALIKLDRRIVKWVLNKYGKLKYGINRAYRWLKRAKKKFPNLFAHWRNFSYL